MLTVITNALETHDLAGLLRISEEMNDAKNKEMFEESIDILTSLLHDVWTIRLDDDILRITNADLGDRLSNLSVNPAVVHIPTWLASLDEIRENLLVNINRKVATDALFVTMTASNR
jgi:hypothetical protein